MRRRAAALCLAGLIALIAAGCGGGDGGNSSTGSGAPGQQASGQTSSPSPDPVTSCSTDPNFDYGQTICITDAGIRPTWLVALLGQPVTWKNETSAPQSIRFVVLKARSGSIPPGGTWSYTPQLPLSIAYRSSSTGRLGRIQVLAQET